MKEPTYNHDAEHWEVDLTDSADLDCRIAREGTGIVIRFTAGLELRLLLGQFSVLQERCKECH